MAIAGVAVLVPYHVVRSLELIISPPTPAQQSCWGVYLFHSVRLSVRPSIRPASPVRSAVKIPIYKMESGVPCVSQNCFQSSVVGAWRHFVVFPVASITGDKCRAIIMCMHPANERRRYSLTPSLIGWVHTQNDPCKCMSLLITNKMAFDMYILGLVLNICINPLWPSDTM